MRSFPFAKSFLISKTRKKLIQIINRNLTTTELESIESNISLFTYLGNPFPRVIIDIENPTLKSTHEHIPLTTTKTGEIKSKFVRRISHVNIKQGYVDYSIYSENTRDGKVMEWGSRIYLPKLGGISVVSDIDVNTHHITSLFF